MTYQLEDRQSRPPRSSVPSRMRTHRGIGQGVSTKFSGEGCRAIQAPGQQLKRNLVRPERVGELDNWIAKGEK